MRKYHLSGLRDCLAKSFLNVFVCSGVVCGNTCPCMSRPEVQVVQLGLALACCKAMSDPESCCSLSSAEDVDDGPRDPAAAVEASGSCTPHRRKLAGGGHVRRHRRCAAGSVAYHSAVAAEGLPSGPLTAEALADWPKQLVVDLAGGAEGSLAMQRLAHVLENGFVLHTDCSGKLSPEATLHLLQHVLNGMGISFSSGGLLNWRSSDIAPLCLEVAQRCPFRPKHVFTGMLSRLPQADQVAVKKLRPSKDGLCDASLPMPIQYH